MPAPTFGVGGLVISYRNVVLAGIGHHLPSRVVASAEIEDRLGATLAKLRIPRGQLAAMTGIVERRWWSAGETLSAAAGVAAARAIEQGGITPPSIGALIYAGVCREQLEPATACVVADRIGVSPGAQVYDISNACLGVMNGILQIANLIELGQIDSGLVCSAETAQQIVELTIARLNAEPTMENFKTALATLTGGSGAGAVLLTRASDSDIRPRLVVAAVRQASEHHRLCRWGPDTGHPASAPMYMETHAIDVLEHGVKLAVETWADLMSGLAQQSLPGHGGGAAMIDKTVCHQVGSANRDAILRALRLDPQRDVVTYSQLGNMGTASLPVSASLAADQGFLRRGDRVAWLGIGSGLNCLMLGWDW